MQCPSHVGEHAPIDMSCLDSRSDISLKIRDQTGRVGVPAVGAVAQALQQLLQQKQITEGKRFIVAPWRHVASNALEGDKDLARGAFEVQNETRGERGGVAGAMRLACRSTGEDFGWARLITLPPRIAQCYPRSGASLIKISEIHDRLRARELVQNTAALVPAGCEARSFAGQASDE